MFRAGIFVLLNSQRVRGVEPLSLAWKAKVRPLYDTCLNMNLAYQKNYNLTTKIKFNTISISIDIINID